MECLKIRELLTKIKNNSEAISYVFGGGGNSALNFLNTILMVELFSASTFGVYLLMVGAVSFITPCISLDIYRYIDKEAQSLTNNFIGLQFVLSIILSIILVLLSVFVDRQSLGISNFALYSLLLASILDALNKSLLVVFKNDKKFMVNIFGEFLKVSVITLILLLFSILNWNSAELATFLVLISNLIMSTYLIVYLFLSSGRIRFSFYGLKESIQYSLPYIPYSFSNFIGSQLDKFLLAGFLDVRTVGEYGLIVQFLSPIKVLSNALSKRFSRIYYSSPLHRKKFHYYRNGYLAIIFYFSLFNLVIVLTYLYITDNSKLILMVVAALFCFNYMIRAYKQLLMVVNTKNGLSMYATYDFLIVTGISLVFPILLIPVLGELGAALAVILTSLASTLFFYFALKKLGWV